MIAIMEQMGEWEDEYELSLSAQEEYELAERIYNTLISKGYLEEP